MISLEIYHRVIGYNIKQINQCDSDEELEAILKYHNSYTRKMGKKLRDKEHPLDSRLVPDYVLQYEISRLFARFVRNKIRFVRNKIKDIYSYNYGLGEFEDDCKKLWIKYSKGELVWKKDN